MDKIFVTKTFLPPKQEFFAELEKMWDSHIVTNDGPYYQKFEQSLRNYTNVKNVVALGNGTLALQIAIRALNLSGEVITTPFSHVATSGSLVWENCRPVYVDIDSETLNIDVSKIEEKITKDTTAILSVHVYSNPCDVEAIEKIAKKHNLKVIYDGAHAFGAKVNDKSIFSFGDITMASFNATKAFHTIEGGALFVKNQEMEDEIRRLAYFGMDKKKNIVQPYGTNAKLIEFCAIMGIVNLKYFDSSLERKKKLYELYKELLMDNPNIRFQKISGKINYSYMPIILKSEEYKIELRRLMNQNGIYPREYFKPSLETVFSDSIKCDIAFDISNRIICLPMSDYLDGGQVKRICVIINEC